MSAITNTPFATGLSAAPNFDFERQGGTLPAALAPSYDFNDGISLDPSVRPTFASPSPAGALGGYGNAQVDGVQSQFVALMSQMLGAVSSLFASIASLFGGAQAQGPASLPGSEAHFANATASSTGDPHEAFAGTSGSGNAVDAKWDSMASHQNLLSSNSFDGGYRISNVVTQANDKGVTMNDRVTVATNGGNTSVTMHEDGSYDVSSYGRDVALQTGVATHVNDGETVTKNSDGSLTIDDSNGRGGTIETTLRSNGGGGVDATTTATNVNLGGYLVDKNDGDRDPVALAGNDGYGHGMPSYAVPSYGPPISSFPPVGYEPPIELDPPLATDATLRTQSPVDGDASGDGVLLA